MPRPVSRADLARLAGVSRVAITKATRSKLAGAVNGDRVDLDHPAVIAYLKARGVDGGAAALTARAPTKSKKPAKKAPRARTPSSKRGRKRAAKPTARRPKMAVAPPPVPPAQALPPPVSAEEPLDEAAKALDLLVTKWGTARGFRDYLLSRKTIADIREKELKINEAEGRVVSRALVMTHVTGIIEGAFRQLLTDTPKTLVRTAYAMARSGTPVEEAEAKARELISAQLGPLKAHAVRVLE